MTSTPPPPTKFDELPDYYLGRLIVYEPMSTDRCHWVVYDGNSKVRCYTRTEAVDYINQVVMDATEDQYLHLARARYFLLKANQELERSANHASGADKLLLDRLSVRLRPFLVEVDNILYPLIKNIANNGYLPNDSDKHPDTEASCPESEGANRQL